MVDVPSQRDLFLVGRQESILQPTRFDPAIVDTVGSDVNLVFNVGASMGEEVARFLLTLSNTLSLSTARGEALDRWMYDRYQLLRQRATAAVVPVQLSRGGSNGFTYPAGAAVGTSGGVVFLTQQAVAFGVNQLGPLTVLATAAAAGQSGNVVAGAINRVLSVAGDTTLTVTNAEPAAGGAEDESDDAFRDRGRAFFAAARRGTAQAIHTGALSAGGIAQATVLEGLDPDGVPAWRVQLYVADANGQANAALAARVRLALNEYRGLGVPVQVIGAVPEYVGVEASGLQFVAGADTTAVLDRAAARVVAAINSMAPGVTLRRATILEALARDPALIIPDNALVSPAGDLVPSRGTVLRTTRERVNLLG